MNDIYWFRQQCNEIAKCSQTSNDLKLDKFYQVSSLRMQFYPIFTFRLKLDLASNESLGISMCGSTQGVGLASMTQPVLYPGEPNGGWTGSWFSIQPSRTRPALP